MAKLYTLFRLFWLALILLALAVLAAPARAGDGAEEALRPRLGYEAPPAADARSVAALLDSAQPQQVQSNPLEQSLMVYEGLDGWYFQIMAQRYGEQPFALTTGTNDKTQARLSPDGNLAVFAAYSDGAYQLWLADIAKGQHYRIQWTTGNSLYPAWSPDGSRIVYQSDRSGQWELYLLNLSGGPEIRLTDDPEYDGMPAWSPDGSRIAFVSRRTGGYRIYSMNPDGSGLVQLSSDPYSAHPVWSPIGHQILYDADADQDGWQELRLMNADGSGAMTLIEGRLISSTEGVDYAANTWRPNASHVVSNELVYRLVNGQWQLQAASLAGFDHIQKNYEQLHYSPALNLDWVSLGPSVPYVQFTHPGGERPAPLTFTWTPAGKDPGAIINNYYVNLYAACNGNILRLTYAGEATKDTWYTLYNNSYQDCTFYMLVRAINTAGWYGPWIASPLVSIETQPPVISLSPIPSAWPYWRPLRFRWQAYDPGGSAITAVYDHLGFSLILAQPEYEYRPWEYEETAVTFMFEAKDATGAIGFSEMADVRFYMRQANGRVTDGRGLPLPQAELTSPTWLARLSQPGVDGAFELLSWEELVKFSLAAPGYGPLAQIATPDVADSGDSNWVWSTHAVLPPLDDVIQNGSFEQPLLVGWQYTSTFTVGQRNTPAHSGDWSWRAGDGLYAGVPGQASLSQSVTIPLSMTNPTLSFFYDILGQPSDPPGALRLWLTPAEQPEAHQQIFEADGQHADWRHIWLDMSPWAGQAITLTFEMSQSERTYALTYLLDDITLGSTYPDLALTATPRQAAVQAGSEFDLELRPANPGALPGGAAQLRLALPAGMSLVSASQPPQIEGQTLTWMFAAGDYRPVAVRLRLDANLSYASTLTLTPRLIGANTEATLANNQVQIIVFVGARQYLPLTRR